MGIEEVDRVLAEWDERLRLVDESLLALEGDPTYQLLAPRAAPRATLEGETARVVGPALEALAELFEQRGLLTDVLERARRVRESMTFWGGADKEREILELLDGPSIELPPAVTPLARRSLLDPTSREVRVEPARLLDAMSSAFERARDAVLTVQHAWERVEPALSSVEGRLADARAAAADLGVEQAVRADLGDAARDLEQLRGRIARDPLGASGDIAQLAPRVEAVASQLGALAAQRSRVHDGIVQARAALQDLQRVHTAARAAVAALPREVEGATAPGTPIEDGLVEGLGPWLDKIAETAAAGRWSSAEVGLGRWDEAARGYLVADARIADALDALVARRQEIAGRLSARQAQAAALAARGAAVDPAAEETAREATRQLALRPTPLARATELVDRYEAAVRARSR